MEFQHMPSNFAIVVMVSTALWAWDAAYSQGQPPPASGKMYCWKNKAGKTECGDKVPYEYQDTAIRELNRQGITTRRTEAMTPEERKAHEAAEEKRLAEKNNARNRRARTRRCSIPSPTRRKSI
jgi:hypothetical protein